MGLTTRHLDRRMLQGAVGGLLIFVLAGSEDKWAVVSWPSASS